MSRFVFLSFVFLAWAFYELSGGADFEPRDRVDVTPEKRPVKQAETRPAPKPSAPVPVVLASASVATPSPVPTVRRQVPAPQPQTASVTTTPAPAALLPLPTPELDLRRVTGNRVNMRGGPGTAYSVLGTLTQGEEVIILREPGNGWAKLRVVESGRIGWMSARLLQPVNSGE